MQQLFCFFIAAKWNSVNGYIVAEYYSICFHDVIDTNKIMPFEYSYRYADLKIGFCSEAVVRYPPNCYLVLIFERLWAWSFFN